MCQFLILVLHVFKSEMWNVSVAEEGESAGRSREHPESGLTCFAIGFLQKIPGYSFVPAAPSLCFLWSCARQQIPHRSSPNCQKLKTMVKRDTQIKGIRTIIFQARNERTQTGVLVKSRRGNVSVETKSGECQSSWKAIGQSLKGDSCS